MTSYRPVVAESPVTGSKAHSAKTKQDSTLEVSGLYPPNYFAYRSELRAAELALSSRACHFHLRVVFCAVPLARMLHRTSASTLCTHKTRTFHHALCVPCSVLGYQSGMY